jgi:hypothetical protein
MIGAAFAATGRTVRWANVLASTTIITAVSAFQNTVKIVATMAISAVNMATNLSNNLVRTPSTTCGRIPDEQDLQVGDPE